MLCDIAGQPPQDSKRGGTVKNAAPALGHFVPKVLNSSYALKSAKCIDVTNSKQGKCGHTCHF